MKKEGDMFTPFWQAIETFILLPNQTLYRILRNVVQDFRESCTGFSVILYRIALRTRLLHAETTPA